MFLSSFTRPDSIPCLTPQKQLSKYYKITQLLNTRSPPQIKQHRRKNFYINSRTYLIENTKKIIRSKNNSGQLLITSTKNKNTHHINPFDLSNRETRKAAAKSMREKIWKKNDVSLSIESEQKRRRYTTVSHTQSELFDRTQEKIPRYRDSVLHKMQQEGFAYQKMKTLEGIEGFSKGIALSTKTNSYNPQKIQVSKLELQEEKQDTIALNRSNLFTNRTVKKNSKILHHYNFTRQSKRPKTTITHTREKTTESENFIQPW